MQLHTWNAKYAKVYQICNICKNIQLYAIYAKNIHICKISMYVSIQGEAKSAALDRTHHLLGMQPEEGTNGPGRSCRRVCAGRHRRGSGQTGPLQSARGPRSRSRRVATNRPFKFGSAPGVRRVATVTGRPWASESSESPPPGPLDRPWASRGHASGSSKRPTVTVSGAAGFRPTGPADRDWLASPRV